MSSYPGPPQESHDASPSTTIILTVVLLAFFFIGFFSIYFCRYFMDSVINSWNLRRTPSGTLVGGSCLSAKTGLDPLLIKSFPTFQYSSVKDLRKENYGLECAICLVEFEDESFLRLLTVCYHVFHQECIDLWLESHTTCPVCRGNLAPSEDSSLKSPEHAVHDNATQESHGSPEPPENAISIDIKEEGDENYEGKQTGESDPGRANKHAESDNEKMERFSRSHSTGHSIAKKREEAGDDKYTLRLPEHLAGKILRGHNWTGSFTTFPELSSDRIPGTRFGEASGTK